MFEEAIEVKTRVNRETYAYLHSEKMALGEKSLSAVLRRMISERRALAEQFSAAFEFGEEGKGGERSREGKIIHTLLFETEERVVRTLEERFVQLDRRLSRFVDRLRELELLARISNSLMDETALLYLCHTPEIPEELKAEYERSALARREKFTKRVISAVKDNPRIQVKAEEF